MLTCPWPNDCKPFSSHNEAMKVVLSYQKADKAKKKHLLDLICRRYWNFIRSHANYFSNHVAHDRMHVENLIQEGYAALINAANDFDPQKSAWITHLTWRVRGAMHHYVRDRACVVKRPSKFYNYPKLLADNTQAAEHNKYQEEFGNLISLDDTADDELDLIETNCHNHNIGQHDDMEAVEDNIIVDQLRKRLKEVEFDVLYSHYGRGETKSHLCRRLGLDRYQLNKILLQAEQKAYAILKN